MDEDERGLKVRVQGHHDVIDVVAVRGLEGHAVKTWQATDTNNIVRNWIIDREFLQTSLPNARIMTFGYNADIFPNIVINIANLAQDLRAELLPLRDDYKNRPILWIGHSLGGIVIKKTLATFYSEFDEAFRKNPTAVVFLGTPHHGSATGTSGLAQVVQSMVTFAKCRSHISSITLELKPFSDSLSEINWNFAAIADNQEIAIRSVYERRPTSCMGFASQIIVPQYSAIMGHRKEIDIGLDADHADLCKFKAPNETNYVRLETQIKHLAKIITKDCLPKAAAPGPAPHKQKHASTPHFVGRDAFLHKLNDFFDPRAAGPFRRRELLLQGLGGAGKTQLALKFAEDYEDRFDAIFWVDATNASTLEQCYKEIASREVPIQDGQHTLQSALQWLENDKRDWLLLFDGADDIDAISDLLPPGSHGNVLYTSRNAMLRGLPKKQILHVNEMNEDDAISLLLRSTRLEDLPENRVLAQQITSDLGYLALAISQAGAYISCGMCDLGDYHHVLQTHRSTLLKENYLRGVSSNQVALYTTWDLSRNALRARATEQRNQGAEIALKLLNIFAFFHFENIMEETFENAAKLGERYLEISSENDRTRFMVYFPFDILGVIGTEWDNRLFRQGTSMLQSFALIDKAPTTRCFSIHRVVHGWTRDCLIGEGPHFWNKFRRIACLIIEASIQLEESRTNTKYKRKLLLHIMCFQQGEEQDSFGDSANRNFVIMLFQTGYYKEAIKVGRQLLGRYEEAFGNHNFHTLECMRSLGSLLLSHGEKNEAQAILSRCLQLSSDLIEDKGCAEFQKSHRNTLRELGCAELALGNFDGAEKLFQNRYDLCHELWGKYHEETLESLDSLGILWSRQGKTEQAERTLREVLSARKLVLGEEHEDTIESMGKIATIAEDQFRIDEAASMYKNTLGLSTKNDGEVAYRTIPTKLSLAAMLTFQGQFAAAEGLFKETIKNLEKLELGPGQQEDFYEWGRVSELAVAIVQMGMGNFKEAERTLRQVLDFNERQLGPDSDIVLNAKCVLATSLQRQDRLSEAEILTREALSRAEKTLGQQHSTTWELRSALIPTLIRLEKYEESKSLARYCLSRWEKCFGSESVVILHHLDQLFTVLSKQGNMDEGGKAIRRSWTINRNRCGPTHPATLKIGTVLARILCKLGKAQEAETLCQQQLEACERECGTNNKKHIFAMISLSEVLYHRSKEEDLEKILRIIFDEAKKVLGEEHIETRTALQRPYETMERQGKPKADTLRKLFDYLTARAMERPEGNTETAGKLLSDEVAASRRDRKWREMVEADYGAAMRAGTIERSY